MNQQIFVSSALLFNWKKFFGYFLIYLYQIHVFPCDWFLFSTQTCISVFDSGSIKITQIRILWWYPFIVDSDWYCFTGSQTQLYLGCYEMMDDLNPCCWSYYMTRSYALSFSIFDWSWSSQLGIWYHLYLIWMSGTS